MNPPSVKVVNGVAYCACSLPPTPHILEVWYMENYDQYTCIKAEYNISRADYTAY
jgi:hypothetical protein